MRRRIIVVGAGLAGAHSVVALREQGYAGELVLVGAEAHPPYDRPPLSKELLRAAAGGDQQAARTLDLDWTALATDLRLGVTARALRPGVLVTDRGELGYDGLVIATGAAPRRLGTGGLVLRTVEDAHALRARLRPGHRLVVVGAGWLGAEVATAAAAAGCRVTALDALDAPLAAALPAPVAAHTRAWWSAAGVDLRLGVRVVAADARGVDLGTGGRLAADTVLHAIGVVPATSWLLGSPVTLGPDGAVVADEHLRTSLDGVVGAGDCVAWWSRRYGRRLRVEHWDNALHAPAVAAAALLAAGDVVYDPVPYFWSEQFGRMVQYAGDWHGAHRLVWRGDPAGDVGWTACWLAGERLVALLAVDRPRDLVQGRRLAEAGTPLDAAALADPARPLRAAVAG